MVRGFCMLLAVFMLSACGAGQAPASSGHVPSQEVIAEPAPDPAGQNGEVSSTEAPASAQQEEQSAGPGDEAPSSGGPSGAEQPGGSRPEEQKAEADPPGTALSPSEEPAETAGTESIAPSQEGSALKITVGDYELLATFEENSSAEEFRELLASGPVTIEMEDYGGFEKVGPLGTSLTRNDTQITTEPGDVILYQGNQITIYYGTNSWSFTRLARIDDPSGLQEKLGSGTVFVTFSLE